MVLDFEEMRRIYRLEKSTSRLVDVPDDFFTQLHGLIDEERKKYFDSLKDLNATRARDFGNLKKLVDEWFLVREKKLLNTVLVCARLEEMDQTHMAEEEKQMFKHVYETLMSHRALTQKVLEANGGFVSIAQLPTAPTQTDASRLKDRINNFGSEMGRRKEKIVETIPPSPSKQTQTIPDDFSKIKVLSEIPSFVGTDMKEYGPYKVGEIVQLPGKIAQLFIARKLGENSS